ELRQQRRCHRARGRPLDRLPPRVRIAERRGQQRRRAHSSFYIKRKQRARHRFYMTMYGTMHGTPTALVCMAVTLLSAPGFAATRQPSGAELLRAVDRLAVVGRVLYVAAHPDDENTRLLAWLANDKLVRAGYLSLTRGEGGQNLIGPEQAPLLGLIRTEEL